MCKHILINNFTLADLETISLFSALSHEHDGYGAIMRTRGNRIETLKALNQGSFYISLVSRLMRGDVTTLVVHHRTSTNHPGLEYAHPFKYKGHYLTHNGVVTVPGSHDTHTENDSEELLHHLIKTDYDTKSIKGYFSCFILTKQKTTVLVDATAPIYTDGRIYCSHKLYDDYTKLELVKRDLDVRGNVLAEQAIEVARSSYGMDLAYLSLGSAWEESTGISAGADLFLSYLTRQEEDYLYSCGERGTLADAVKSLCEVFGLVLTETEYDEIRDIFQADNAPLMEAL